MANMQIVCLAIFAIYCGITVATPLLGEKECTWGPTYWCSNITNAKGCKAVSHCIKAVWEKQKFPVDDDDVCTICTNMVKQARDQLESNQTQEDLKAVFEGSCKLIPIDIVSNECVKLVDEFIPELVETLASQMNPQAVCTVAGLCNNARIDKMLEEAKKNKVSEESPKETNLCAGCHTVIGNMRSNFDDLSYTGFLQSALKICFKLGSFSDSCATALVTNFENIYSHLKENFYADNVCHDFGTCTEKFHQHESKEKKTSNVQITPMGGVGMIASKEGDDVPCELCEQLVKHLRDILVANTTESEFKRVLDGLCKQSGTFKSECLSIVDQYYPLIYSFLTNELDANSVCGMVGICPKTLADEDAPIAPILLMPPTKIQGTLDRVLIEEDESKNFKHSVSIGDNQMKVKVVTPELGQLPIERMMVAIPQNQELCTFCQYFLHFIQVHISDAKTEQEIKDLVESGCKILPNAIDSQCEAFVDAYGNAIIALLVQEIDPSQVCPLLTLCPKEEQVTNVEILMTSGNGDKPSCPLCLFAVEQLQTMLKDNKTEESIQNALDNLCSHLPTKLKAECSDFVDTYSKQLFEMLVAEFTPQEVCVYLKLCTDNKPDVSSLKTLSAVDQYHSKRKPMADHNNFKKPLLPKEMLVDTSKHVQIETNEIPDNTFNGKPLIYADTTPKVAHVEASPGCIICEFILSEIDKELQDKHNADEVKKVVHSICNHLPSTVGKECNDFVDKYADLVITLLSQGLAPAEFCGAIALCTDQNIKLQNNIMECAVCEEAIDVVEQLLTNPEVDRKLEHIIEKTCYALPARYLDRCTKLMSTYGESIIHLVSHLADSGKVCSEIGMCAAESFSHLQMEKVAPKKKLVGGDRCTWGPSYWCKSEDRANECGAINHCRERVWLAEKPPGRVARSTELLGKKKCSYGPSYWCENEDQANECKAINHCRERVWLAEKPPGRVARSTELLGKKKCSYGPSYWCENEDQANECKALEHCRQRVWKAQKPAGN